MNLNKSIIKRGLFVLALLVMFGVVIAGYGSAAKQASEPPIALSSLRLTPALSACAPDPRVGTFASLTPRPVRLGRIIAARLIRISQSGCGNPAILGVLITVRFVSGAMNAFPQPASRGLVFRAGGQVEVIGASRFARVFPIR